MTDPEASNSRTARRAMDMLDAIRRRIVSGEFPPGAPLPTRADLKDLHSVSNDTIQRVFDSLGREGFVETRGRAGSFVAPHPPHQFRYGAIFHSDPSGGADGYWPPLWGALHNEAMRVSAVDPRRTVVPFFNMTGHSDVEDFTSLLRQLRAGMLAGLIFTTGIPPLLADGLADAPDVPRVIIDRNKPARDTAAISLNPAGFFRRALDCFRARGVKRVAIFDCPGALPDRALLQRLVRSRGMETKPFWLLEVNHSTRATAFEVAQLLMSRPRAERPDGVLVSNPFLVEHVTKGIAALGLRSPSDLHVVAGCALPYYMPHHLPVEWLGCDIRDSMRIAIEMIDRQRTTGSRSGFATLKTIVESELSPADPLQRLAEK